MFWRTFSSIFMGRGVGHKDFTAGRNGGSELLFFAFFRNENPFYGPIAFAVWAYGFLVYRD
jgi:hypothetical protein